MNNNRNNRRRGRGNRNNQGGGNSQNRIDSRARGNAPQLLDKYKKLAQDAQHNGDRVQAEYYLQFADHYFRVIADNKARQDEARAKRNENRQDNQSGDDGDDEDGGKNRKNNRRSRSRRDEQDNAPNEEGEAGVEGEAVSGDEESAKPKKRARKPKDENGGDYAERKPRRSRSRKDDGDSSAGEIDSSVLPPAIGGDDASKSSDPDDNLEAVG